MGENLISVGLDVGTTSSQMVVSRLKVENRAGSFSVPRMEITGREVIYQSPVHFTPLLGENKVDAAALRAIIEGEYGKAGLKREDVDTGAIIITGETSRKENARAVLEELAGFAGEFVVTAAGPALEGILAAKGAGAVEYAAQMGKILLHMDIGGGTSNLVLLKNGEVAATGCMNVGGRLVKLAQNREVLYVSPALAGLTGITVGQIVTKAQMEQLVRMLVQGLEMAAGLRQRTRLLEELWTREAGAVWEIPERGAVISFSGGVADCVDSEIDWMTYGDIGPVLGRAIRESRLCQGEYRLGQQTIRATVIGAGCHSTQLSGSTVFCRGMKLPLQNIPVANPGQGHEGPVMRRVSCPRGYENLKNLARQLAESTPEGPVLVCMAEDSAKALGQLLALQLPEREILCIDGIDAGPDSFLDIGEAVGMAFPVVVKTLVFDKGKV